MTKGLLRSTLLFAASVVAFSRPSFAETDVSGLWQGTLSVSSDVKVTLLFNLSRGADGSYSAVLDTLAGAEARKVPVSAVKVGSNNLAFEVRDLSGSFEGAYDGEAAINGKWKQEGTSIPLVFTRSRAPSLAGDWQGDLATPIGNTRIGFRFEKAGDGSNVGYVIYLSNGMRARMTNVEFASDKLTFQQPAMQLKYEGAIVGMAMRGTWTQTSLGKQTSVPLAMTRGPFEVPVTRLSLSAEDMEKVRGTWTAESGDAAGVTLRFETTTDGKHVGYLDLPAFSLAGAPVSEANLVDGKLFVKIAMLGSEYSAQVSSGQFQGDWKHPGGAFPLVLKRQ